MLAIWGLITILGMILAIASRRVSPLVALFLFPVTACLAAGLLEVTPADRSLARG